MANWKNTDSDREKDLLSIGAMFETNRIKKMYDISGLYPTKIIKRLGINSERYAVKLSNPEKFTVSEILRLAYILGIDPNLVIDVIQKESEERIESVMAKRTNRDAE